MSKRAAARIAHQEDDMVPPVRLKSIRTADGTVLRRPTVMAGTWRDPEMPVESYRRTPRLITGYRRYDVLTRLARRGERKAEGGRVTDEHLRAASKFAADYERALLGTTRALDLAGVRSPPGPRDLLDLAREAARRRYQQACQAVARPGRRSSRRSCCTMKT